MRIALDAMGGDYAPGEIVAGAEAAAKEFGVDVTLVGDETRIKRALSGQGGTVRIVQAGQVIEMGEHPAQAVRRKRDASVVRAVELVRDGQADAVVSAGNTGALMAAALLGLGRVAGIERPALVSLFPNDRGRTVILDVGANVDCKPHHLVQFAVMGAAYAEKLLGIKKPRVGLLSIGEERTKGNELTLAAYPLLESAPLNFIGNVEGRDFFHGGVDVVVCDGFIGNVVLKTGEGLAMFLERFLQRHVEKNLLAKVTTLAALTTLKELRQQFDYNEYGGVPLLGVNGVAIVAHGSSRAKAITNAVRVAKEAAENGLVSAIAAGLADIEAEGAINAHA
ncbi:MAG: phosphate acyltransferase PlsX [Thermoanaerobacterales bacterium]|nr:phosphate acyltransferase PlsX [Bacillota bacterium]MDI6907313.1 phosphate acyltransferase PlsX [Thermoanaerobacterales bacterium]